MASYVPQTISPASNIRCNGGLGKQQVPLEDCWAIERGRFTDADAPHWAPWASGNLGQLNWTPTNATDAAATVDELSLLLTPGR